MAVRGVVTVPASPDARRHSAEAEAGATDPAAHEQQASSMHLSMQRQGHTGTSSSSHACMERVSAQAVLLMACELLRYHRTDAGYDTRLTRIAQLVNKVGEAPTPSRSLRPPPSRDNEEA
ncbi:hypothetical protein D1007_53203 [Hordeum vulgare]|nr:hypothetical protein D1007_53203 [Hordeum vulgare]